MSTINFLPILIASAVSFAISSLWYSPFIFGNAWTNLLKISDRDIANISPKNVWLRYLIQFIATLINFSVLAFAIVSFGVNSGSDGAFVGLIAWLGFIATGSVARLLWEKEPLKLVLIDAINDLLILTIGGAIIGAWR